jgi:hypothetical protein
MGESHASRKFLLDGCRLGQDSKSDAMLDVLLNSCSQNTINTSTLNPTSYLDIPSPSYLYSAWPPP